MTLAQIRAKVIEQSGRRNYVTETGADNGADYFINAASRALDREQETTKSERWYQESIPIGGYNTSMQYCRVASQVWFENADGARVQLTPIKYDEMMTEYPKLGNTDVGTPLYWAHEPITAAPGQTIPVENLDLNGIIFMSPTDAIITLYVYGRFYSAPLEADTDENYWSVNHPDILILASMRTMDYHSRNREGELDYAQIVNGLLAPIDRDLAEWDAASRLVMEG